MLDRDPPARRMALVRWAEDGKRWELVFAARCTAGPLLRSRLEEMAKDYVGPTRIFDVEGRRGSVEAAVAALGAYVASPAKAGELVGVQLALFREVK